MFFSVSDEKRSEEFHERKRATVPRNSFRSGESKATATGDNSEEKNKTFSVLIYLLVPIIQSNFGDTVDHWFSTGVP